MGHEEGLLAGTKLILERMNIGIGTHNMEAAIKAYLLGSGMVLVPRKPTEGMELAGDDHAPSSAVVWFEMLSAAQDPFKSNK